MGAVSIRIMQDQDQHLKRAFVKKKKNSVTATAEVINHELPEVIFMNRSMIYIYFFNFYLRN